MITSTSISKTEQRNKLNNAFRQFFKSASAIEARDLTTTGTGYLVPQEVFGTLAENLKAFAPIIDIVTVQENLTGRATQFVSFDPTGNSLQVQSEDNAPTEQDFTVSKSVLNLDLVAAKTQFSNQLLSDSNFDLLSILRTSAFKQLGRTLDYNVVAGSSPNGSAMANGANLLANAPVGFTTSAVANGIAWTDITSLVSSVDPAFGSSEKAAFTMSYGTFVYLLAQKTSTGARLYPELSEMKLGSWGVVISAAMPQTLAANNVQILFGDLSQVGVAHSGLGIQIIREAAGLVEKNLSQLIASSRVASTLLLPGAVKALKLGN